MDNNNRSYEDILNDLKVRVDVLRDKCNTAQNNLEDKVSAISKIDKEIGQTEFELSEYRSRTEKINELWKELEIEVDKLKWMQEKASVIRECNRREYELQLKTMDIIRQNYSNLTTFAYKTVRQEVANKIINEKINKLAARRKELENKLTRLLEIKSENESRLTEARIQLMAAKTREDTVLRLRQKLHESEALKSKAIEKLNNLKMSRLENFDNSKSKNCTKSVLEFQ